MNQIYLPSPMEPSNVLSTLSGLFQEKDINVNPVSYTHLDVYKRQLLIQIEAIDLTEITVCRLHKIETVRFRF